MSKNKCDETHSAELILVNVLRENWSHTVGAERLVIGRGPGAHICIPAEYKTVSRQHAEIWRDETGYWIQDLGSRGGTQINGIAVNERGPVRLYLNDRITLATLELKLSAPELEALHPSTDGAPESDSDLETMNRATMAPNTIELIAQLSPAELEVLLCLGRGFVRDDEIGAELHRSPHTIRTHFNSIFKKFGFHSREELLSWLTRPNG